MHTLKLHSVKTVGFGETLLIHANAQAPKLELRHSITLDVGVNLRKKVEY